MRIQTHYLRSDSLLRLLQTLYRFENMTAGYFQFMVQGPGIGPKYPACEWNAHQLSNHGGLLATNDRGRSNHIK